MTRPKQSLRQWSTDGQNGLVWSEWVDVRIIAGALKGRHLSSPDWPGLRPTSDRLRETLFNILSDRVCGGTVLDACAGTGALGLEALSRGAKRVVFVERDQRASALIEEHVTRFRLTDCCDIVRGAIPAVTDDCMRGPFDVVLVDPPYDDPEIDAILSSVGACLADHGVLVLERDRHSIAPRVAGLEVVRHVVSGGSTLDFFRRTAGASSPEQGA